MSFLISTASIDVSLRDLGIIVVHPTIDRDFLIEFTAEELSKSSLLTEAIQSGLLILKVSSPVYGDYEVDPTEYYPGFAVQNQNVQQQIEEYITQNELTAGKNNVLIDQSAVSLPIISTASITKNIYTASGLFQKWVTSYGDKAVITGGAAAGIYTVDEIIDQFQVSVLENIPNTSNVGTLSIFHPPGSTLVGVDDSNFSTISGVTLQSTLQSIDDFLSLGGSGLTEPQHELLNTLVHGISEDCDVFCIRNSDGIASIIEAKKKISGILIRRMSNLTNNADGILSNYKLEQCDESGVVIKTLDVSIDNNGKHVVTFT